MARIWAMAAVSVVAASTGCGDPLARLGPLSADDSRCGADWVSTISEGDTDGDGRLDQVTTTLQDGRERIRRRQVELTAEPDRGWTRWYGWDEGLQVSEELDQGNDGSVDAWSRWEYTAPGQRLRRISDTDGDDLVDLEETWHHDPRGLEVSSSLDWDLDGEIDSRREYHYDARDRLVRTYIYSPESLWSVVHRGYDDDDNLVYFATDQRGDGSVDVISTWRYRPPNRLLETTYDFEGDGDLDVHDVYIYGADDLLRVRETDRVPDSWSGDPDQAIDGVVDERTVYEHVDGQLSSWSSVAAPGGSLLSRYDLRVECVAPAVR